MATINAPCFSLAGLALLSANRHQAPDVESNQTNLLRQGVNGSKKCRPLQQLDNEHSNFELRRQKSTIFVNIFLDNCQ